MPRYRILIKAAYLTLTLKLISKLRPKELHTDKTEGHRARNTAYWNNPRVAAKTVTTNYTQIDRLIVGKGTGRTTLSTEARSPRVSTEGTPYQYACYATPATLCLLRHTVTGFSTSDTHILHLPFYCYPYPQACILLLPISPGLQGAAAESAGKNHPHRNSLLSGAHRHVKSFTSSAAEGHATHYTLFLSGGDANTGADD